MHYTNKMYLFFSSPVSAILEGGAAFDAFGPDRKESLHKGLQGREELEILRKHQKGE